MVRSMSIITIKKTTLLSIIISSLAFSIADVKASDDTALLQQLANSEQRSNEHKARNMYRNPAESKTLSVIVY